MTTIGIGTGIGITESTITGVAAVGDRNATDIDEARFFATGRLRFWTARPNLPRQQAISIGPGLKRQFGIRARFR
jgi:hypothetical protein